MLLAREEQRESPLENIVASGARIPRFRCSLFSPLSSSLHRPQGALGLQALAGGFPFYTACYLFIRFFLCLPQASKKKARKKETAIGGFALCGGRRGLRALDRAAF